MAKITLTHPTERQRLRGIGKEKDRHPTFEQFKEKQRIKKIKKKRNRGK